MAAFQLFGRTLQTLGLVALPVGMFLEITGSLGRRSIADLLLIMIFGFAAFHLGRMLEGFSNSPGSRQG
jgi:hypothetical protein